MVTQFNLSLPIALMAASRIGFGSTKPGGNCCVATEPPIAASSPAKITGNANVLDILPPIKRVNGAAENITSPTVYFVVAAAEGGYANHVPAAGRCITPFFV